MSVFRNVSPSYVHNLEFSGRGFWYLVIGDTIEDREKFCFGQQNDRCG